MNAISLPFPSLAYLFTGPGTAIMPAQLLPPEHRAPHILPRLTRGSYVRRTRCVLPSGRRARDAGHGTVRRTALQTGARIPSSSVCSLRPLTLPDALLLRAAIPLDLPTQIADHDAQQGVFLRRGGTEVLAARVTEDAVAGDVRPEDAPAAALDLPRGEENLDLAPRVLDDVVEVDVDLGDAEGVLVGLCYALDAVQREGDEGDERYGPPVHVGDHGEGEEGAEESEGLLVVDQVRDGDGDQPDDFHGAVGRGQAVEGGEEAGGGGVVEPASG
jgi:hypothetical protein